jgi:D-glycero-D-manno-heptose 1,7-bisphosphate phosphatase
MKLKAVFLDKDGALVPRVETSDKKIQLNDKFVEGLQLLQSHGYLLVIVSNKNADNSEDKPDDFRNGIVSSCSRMGIYLDGIYYGKPVSEKKQVNADVVAEPLLKAATDMDIDLSKSWIVGDIPGDVEAGKKLGCNTVLVTHDKNESARARARYKARNLAEAAKKIVKGD